MKQKIENEEKLENIEKTCIEKNTVYNVIRTFSTIMFPLITFPYISRILGATNIGKINFSASIVSYFGLIATLGITTYAVRECSKVKRNKEQLSKIVSEIFSINLITSLIAYVILAVSLFCIPKLQKYQLLIIIQSLSIIFTTLGTDWLNTVMEDFKYITIRTFIFQVVALTAMFFFVYNSQHYVIYAVIGLISSSGANLANIFYRKKFCKVKFTWQMNWKKHFPPIMLLFAMMLSQQILGNLDTTMIGFMIDDTAVGLYTTARKIINIVSQVISSLTWVVMPQLSLYFMEGDYKKINKLLRYAMNFSAVLGLPCVIGINVLAHEIVFVVGGASYLSAANCLRILTVDMALGFFVNIFGNMIALPSGREKVFMFACVVSAFVNSITNFICISRFGIVGAAATTVISTIIMLIILVKKSPKEIHFWERKKDIITPVVGSVLIFFISYFLKRVVKTYYYRLALIIGIDVPFYFLFLIVTKNEFVISMVTTFVNRIRKTGNDE